MGCSYSSDVDNAPQALAPPFETIECEPGFLIMVSDMRTGGGGKSSTLLVVLCHHPRVRYGSIISNRIIKIGAAAAAVQREHASVPSSDGYTVDVCVSSRFFREGTANGTDSSRIMLTDSSDASNITDKSINGNGNGSNGVTASEEMVDKVLQYINATHACSILCSRSSYFLTRALADGVPVLLPLTAGDASGDQDQGVELPSASAPLPLSRIKRLSTHLDPASSSSTAERANAVEALTMDQLYALWRPETPNSDPEGSRSATLQVATRQATGPPLLMKGALKKRGHSTKNWKLRQVVVEAGVLTYYADSLELHPYGVDMKDRLVLVDYDVEKLSYNRFRLFYAGEGPVGGSRKDLMLVCEARERSEEYVDLWVEGLTEHIRYAGRVMPRDVEIDTAKTFEKLFKTAVGAVFGSESRALRDGSSQLNAPLGGAESFTSAVARKEGSGGGMPGLPTVPEVYKGFVLKEGHIIRSWKCRFFVLSHGIVAYYAKELECPPYGSDVKGCIQLAGAVVEMNSASGPPGAVLSYGSGGRSGMQLTFKTTAERDVWIDSFNKHITYANDCAAADAEGNFDVAGVLRYSKISIADINKFSVFLLPEVESIIATAEVCVKAGLLSASQTQQLVLTSSGRLLFIDYKICEVKRALLISRGSQVVTAEEVDSDSFIILNRADSAAPSIAVKDAVSGAAFWVHLLSSRK